MRSLEGRHINADRGRVFEEQPEVVKENPDEVISFREGNEGVANWLFGQVMKKARGQANPQILREELMRQLRN